MCGMPLGSAERDLVSGFGGGNVLCGRHLTCAGAFQRQVFGDPSEVLAPKTFGVAVTFLVGPSVSSTVELYLSCKNQFFRRWSPVSGKASVSCVAAVLVRPYSGFFLAGCWV